VCLYLLFGGLLAHDRLDGYADLGIHDMAPVQMSAFSSALERGLATRLLVIDTPATSFVAGAAE
jgi:hypothetical protein